MHTTEGWSPRGAARRQAADSAQTLFATYLAVADPPAAPRGVVAHTAADAWTAAYREGHSTYALISDGTRDHPARWRFHTLRTCVHPVDMCAAGVPHAHDGAVVLAAAQHPTQRACACTTIPALSSTHVAVQIAADGHVCACIAVAASTPAAVNSALHSAWAHIVAYDAHARILVAPVCTGNRIAACPAHHLIDVAPGGVPRTIPAAWPRFEGACVLADAEAMAIRNTKRCVFLVCDSARHAKPLVCVRIHDAAEDVVVIAFEAIDHTTSAALSACTGVVFTQQQPPENFQMHNTLDIALAVAAVCDALLQPANHGTMARTVFAHAVYSRALALGCELA